jgi:hypothetical protein
MANNLAAAAPKIMAAGLIALRQNAVTSRLVNRNYDVQAAEIGSIIDIPISSAIASRPVTPSHQPPAGVDSAPTKASIEFDFWEEAPFHLTDKDFGDVGRGTIPMAVSEAIKSVVNSLDAYVLDKMVKASFNVSGTAGTTPFATTTAVYQDARKLLNIELASLGDRRVLLDPSAEANALGLSLFQDADKRGDQGGVIEGMIGRKLGADWHMNQNVPEHTAGVPGGTPLVVGAHAIGDATIAIDGMTATTGTYKEGDVVSFAGHTQTYVITADVTASGTGTATLPINPPLRAAVADNAAITLTANHTANMIFHRDYFALATRTLKPAEEGLGVITQVAVDQVTGLALRLEITRQYKQTQWAFDILAGGVVPRPELGVRLLG